MENIIFYTELDKVVGCTRPQFIEGEPFCDTCQGKLRECAFQGQCTNTVQQMVRSEQHLKATFVRLYLEKMLRI